MSSSPTSGRETLFPFKVPQTEKACQPGLWVIAAAYRELPHWRKKQGGALVPPFPERDHNPNILVCTDVQFDRHLTKNAYMHGNYLP